MPSAWFKKKSYLNKKHNLNMSSPERLRMLQIPQCCAMKCYMGRGNTDCRPNGLWTCTNTQSIVASVNVGSESQAGQPRRGCRHAQRVHCREAGVLGWICSSVVSTQGPSSIPSTGVGERWTRAWRATDSHAFIPEQLPDRLWPKLASNR